MFLITLTRGGSVVSSPNVATAVCVCDNVGIKNIHHTKVKFYVLLQKLPSEALLLLEKVYGE